MLNCRVKANVMCAKCALLTRALRIFIAVDVLVDKYIKYTKMLSSNRHKTPQEEANNWQKK